MHTFTVVPLPSSPRTRTSPPSKAARSRMPSKPMDLVLRFSASEIPRPLSFTSSMT